MSDATIDLDLRDNTNPWGSPPAATAAIRRAIGDSAQYPHAGGEALRETIASAIGVRAAEVIVGCGSDDVIDAAFRALAAPGDVVAHPAPTFGMVGVFARSNHLRTVGVPMLPDGAADVDALLATRARLIYLATPNNPTGTTTPPGEIRRLVASAPGIVLIDEAYAEFCDEPDWRAHAPVWDRVLVTRTFSKAWGLAGLRVGYGVGSAAIVAAVAAALGPYKVNALAARAATAALLEDGAWMRDRAARARTARDRLAAFLRARHGIAVWPSQANFVFGALDGLGADEVAQQFARRGIGVRAFASLPFIGDAIRIGVAAPRALARVEQAAAEVWPCA